VEVKVPQTHAPAYDAEVDTDPRLAVAVKGAATT